ncbi:MAG: ABC transporter permease [Shimia sp.]
MQPPFFSGTGRVISALMLREMSTTYGRTPGGYLWAILEPVATSIVFAFGFSLLLKAPSLGTNFLLFYATGLLPLRFFQQISGNVGLALLFNLPLMSYPRVTYADTILARGLLALLTQAMVGAIIMTGIFITQDLPATIDFRPVLAGYGYALLLGMGAGTFNCFMFLWMPVWRTIWGILTRPLLLISGIFFTYEDLPEVAQNLLWFNPLLHVSGLVREGFYSTYKPAYISPEFLLGMGLLPFAIGALMLWRFGRDILYR